MATPELPTASVLAFERKLNPSDGLFSAGRWDQQTDGAQWKPVELHEKSVRGTLSNRLKTKDPDPAKLDASIQSPNLQTVDVATLPNDADTLRLRFTLRVLGGAGEPAACNNALYQARLGSLVKNYRDEIGFAELARRYAINLANGRFLWRNRMGAEQIVVHIHHLEKGEIRSRWRFNALDFSLRTFDVPDAAQADLQAVAELIERGLAGQEYVLLEIVAYARIGDGQEVYPSQELILDKGDKRGQKSKTLYAVNGVAALHSQKIGNALRTIDTWYPRQDDEIIGPIAVEPYGSVTTQARAYRQPKAKADFYSLLDAWALKNKPPATGDQHFVMATFIRGGVFGDSEKE
ncbi:MAG TPA: type I-F CRISPR-associated protein Csy3 [Accumulibacter sp.]|nr:type I-F CRISPR-associated protein Csy3 [Accumulibacter sp.]